jgi:hypothetical protein
MLSYDSVTLFNVFEVVLWSVLGLAILFWRALPMHWMSWNLPLACALFGFALSDYIEIQTGAWWQPWWLFPFKACCFLSMIYFMVLYYRHHSRNIQRP